MIIINDDKNKISKHHLETCLLIVDNLSTQYFEFSICTIMATSSHHLSTIPPSSSKAATCDKPVVKNGKDFAPEPEASESKTWESQSFILNNRGRDGEPISDNEHIAFLLYWLSGIIFCARNIQVEIAYVPLAVMLAEGKKLCLAKLFLTRLYLTLDWITAHMREKKRITNADGPVWFFQLWLSAIFESELQPRSTQKSLTDSAIAGQRLLNLVFPDRLMPSHDKMKYFFRAFYYLPEKDHNINLTPFANCQTGPEWLTQSLTPAGVTQKESIIIWSQFLTPQLLFAGFPGENDLRTAVYMPNAVSRQFGLAQAIPSPYHFQESQHSHVKTISLEDLLRLQKDNVVQRNKFHLFPFKPCPLTTYSFFSWWKNYYSSIEVSFNTCCQRMTTILVMQQVRRAKKENTTTPLAANPLLRRSSSRLIGKKKRNFNSSNRRAKRRLEPIEASVSSSSNDKNDTSDTSNDNLDGPVISQHNERDNENISSSDESVSKFSLEKDVNALSASDRLASQVTVTPTISLIAPNTENMMAATSNRPMPKTNANKLQASELPQVSGQKNKYPSLPSMLRPLMW
ncbi:hypothetical protein Ahy_B08g093354 [Arachis hypogaea]|uniref:Aminotransferase-like plant mobile domain-containing protein n=1 Tax=Arachis hypogaea TaxID=3818 RepID=A0A444Y5X3_ARAHY|nr:hypothetical protein Ahy_B08g093354 [Arachis hypogaea]